MASPSLAMILRDLERHKTIFDADMIGGDVLDIAARIAVERFNRQIDPDGNGWPKLSASYERWKGRHGLGMQMGVLHGPMSDDEHFRGERTITKAEAISVFGTNPAVRQEAEWFEEGDATRNRDPRPFTAISLEAVLAIDRFLDNCHAASL
jgi:hypothetical protein